MAVTHLDILTQAADWLDAGAPVGLATVVQTWGSSPRPAGSHMAIRGDGQFVGSVSGGCIEGAVIQEALASMADGRTRLLDFGVSDEQAWEVGLACGGRVQVSLVPLADAQSLRTVAAEAGKRHPVITLSPLGSGLAPALHVLRDPAEAARLGLPAAGEELQAMMRADRTGPLTSSPGHFARVYLPPPRMLIVGAVHIAQALAPMAAMAGLDVTVIDPRRAFADASRFPGVALSSAWPDEALAALQPDALTAVVTLTHDPKLDDPALEAALRSAAFYIGSLGSSRTHARRLERLREAGFDEQALGRIHAPVGLDLGGRLPAEIAVSILAEALQVRYRGA